MEEIIIEIINNFGYMGLFFLIAIENIFPPIPSEVILTFGGFLTTVSDMSFAGVLIATTFGALVGAIALYGLGYLLSYRVVDKLFNSKLGNKLKLKEEHFLKANNWFLKYEQKAVFFGRFIPIVRSLISIPAGISKMDFKKFVILTLLGTTTWNIILIYLGKITGENRDLVIKYFDMYSNFAFIIIILIVFGFIIYKLKKQLLKYNK